MSHVRGPDRPAGRGAADGRGLVVVHAAGAQPDFLDANRGGRFKDRDPTVDATALEANWVDRAEVVYIGEADNLRRRLRQFAQFGAGKPIGHWGGRLIWQLTRSAELLVAWRETPGMVPKEVETAMLAEFRAAYGNRRLPTTHIVSAFERRRRGRAGTSSGTQQQARCTALLVPFRVQFKVKN